MIDAVDISTQVSTNTFLHSDSEPPELTYCPENMVKVALPRMTYMTKEAVHWDKPKYEDNSGLLVKEQQITGLSSNEEFPEGVHLIEYIGRDEEGNKNTDCRFTVTVRGRFLCVCVRGR